MNLAVAQNPVTNLLTNSELDTDLNGWVQRDLGSRGQAQWRSDSATNDPDSGSMEVLQRSGDFPQTAEEIAYQCIPVTPGATYTFGASVRPLTENTSDSGRALMMVTYQQQGCSGDPNFVNPLTNGIFFKQDLNWPAGQFSGWITGRGQVTIPSNASEVRVVLSIFDYTVDDRYGVLFDDVVFGLAAATPEASISGPVQEVLTNTEVTIDLGISNAGSSNPATELEANILSSGLLELVSENCPGDMINLTVGDQRRINWFNIPDQPAGAEFSCQMTAEIQPGFIGPNAIFSSVGCSSCIGFSQPQSVINVAPQADLTVSLAAQSFQTQGERIFVDVSLENLGTKTFSESTQLRYPLSHEPGTLRCNQQPVVVQEPGLATLQVVLSAGQQVGCTLAFQEVSSPEASVTVSLSAPTPAGIDYDISNNQDSVDINLVNLRVNSPADLTDFDPGDGQCLIADSPLKVCTLRAAIAEANALPGHQTITLPMRAEPYTLSQTNGNDVGDLSISEELTINGETVAGERPMIVSDFDNPADRQRLLVISAPLQRVSLSNLDLVGQSAEQSGNGGLIFALNTELKLTNVSLSGGAAQNQGGALWSNSNVDLDEVAITDNSAPFGAGAAFDLTDPLASVEIFRSRFASNRSSQPGSQGGGLWQSGGLLEMASSSLEDNDAEAGGAMALLGVTANVNTVTVSGNRAALEGGGFWLENTDLQMALSTVAFNEAGPGDNFTGAGGGLFIDPGSSATITSSLFHQNAARAAAPLFLAFSATCSGTLTSAGYNTVSPSTQTDGDCLFSPSLFGDVINSAAALGPLDTSGSVSFHALTAIGNEIDQASPDCFTTFGEVARFDARNRSRPLDGDDDGGSRCDKGAYEAEGNLPAVNLVCPTQVEVSAGSSVEISCEVESVNDFAGDVDLSCGQMPPTCALPINVLTLAANTSDSFTVEVDGDAVVSPDNILLRAAIAGAGSSDAIVAVTTTDQPVMVPTVDVNASVTGGGRLLAGAIGIDCPGNCSASATRSSDNLSFSASETPGWDFQTWTGDCAGSPGINPMLGFAVCQVAATSDITVGAVFTEAPTEILLSVDISGAGTVTSIPIGINCTSSCAVPFALGGADVVLAATPDPGWTFAGWTGDCSGTDSCVLDRSSDKAAGANFVFDNPPEPLDFIFSSSFE